MSENRIDVLNELRKFQRTYMIVGLDEEAEAIAAIFSAVSDLIAADTAYDIAKQAKWDASGIKQQQAAEKAFQSAKSRRSSALSRVRSS